MDDPAAKAARMAQTMAGALNVAGLFAAPRVLQAVSRVPSEMPTREHLLEQLDALASVLASSDVETRAIVMRLRAACAEWTPGPEAPIEMQRDARALFAAFGTVEPPGGWDAFELPHDDA